MTPILVFTNGFDDQGLGIPFEAAWNESQETGWTFSECQDMIIPENNDKPVDIPDWSSLPNHLNQSSCIGFTLDDYQAIIDWQFRYCIGE